MYEEYSDTMNILPITGRLMPYNWMPISQQIDGQWMIYVGMLDEFARGLANVINDLTHKERQLRAWAIIVTSFIDEQKMKAIRDFIDPLGSTAINLPYVIRSRFAFATAHLCHQANRFNHKDWIDDLREDGKIDQSDADRCGKMWRKYNRLKQNVERINSRDFVIETRNFRNVYTHRLEPRFVVGISEIITRHPLGEGRVRYDIGGQPPLDLTVIADLLTLQRDRCYLAFEAFQALIREQIEAIGIKGQ